MSYIWKHLGCNLFRGGSFTQKCALSSSMYFHCLMAHFFLVLKNIPWSECAIVHLTTHIVNNVLVASNLGYYEKSSCKTPCAVSVWTPVFNSFGHLKRSHITGACVKVSLLLQKYLQTTKPHLKMTALFFLPTGNDWESRPPPSLPGLVLCARQLRGVTGGFSLWFPFAFPHGLRRVWSVFSSAYLLSVRLLWWGVC